MARKLKPHEFYNEISKRSKCPKDKVQDVWENFADFCSDELKTYGFVNLPLIGDIYLKTIPEKVYRVPNSDADKIRLNTTEKNRQEVVAEHYELKYRPSETLKRVINDDTITRTTWKHARDEVRKKQQQMEEALITEEDLLARKQEIMAKVQRHRLENIQNLRKYKKTSKRKKEQMKEQERKDLWGLNDDDT
jgi:nucleoid DNA-binding protein